MKSILKIKDLQKLMIKLHHRSHAKEGIDAPQMDAGVLRQTYQQIKNINIYTLGYWPTMSAVGYFLERHGSNRTIKILDIGCGDGETLRRIDDYGYQRKFSLKLTGMDLNREVIASAVALSKPHINFIHGDILSHQGCDNYDLVINSLTMHHLSDAEIVRLMQWMRGHAQIGWFISDLHRHTIAYYFIKYFTKWGGFNPLICHDAPLSVARSFRRQEWVDLLTQAGFNLDLVQIFWYPNFHYGIRYEK